MIGFKAFNSDLTCRGFQYEVGKTYEMDEPPIICERGFHFCKTIKECYNYYPENESTRICIIDATGDIAEDLDGGKFCTNKITILAEIVDPDVRKGNTGFNNAGYYNTGCYNTGDDNSGNHNTGYGNTGYTNYGNRNTANFNTGNRNTGNCNAGDDNSGNYNKGDKNTGHCNTGNNNSGCGNRGNRNTGDFNLGNDNTGVFNTGTPCLMFFDKPSTWTYKDWYESRARDILIRTLGLKCKPWSKMTQKERAAHPEAEVTDRILTHSGMQSRWDSLPKEDKAEVRALPNFDEAKFLKITKLKHF